MEGFKLTRIVTLIMSQDLVRMCLMCLICIVLVFARFMPLVDRSMLNDLGLIILLQ